MHSELPHALYDPLSPSSVPNWVKLSVHTGTHRAEVEHNGNSSVARALMIIPSILVTPPGWQLQPYIGAGFGLSLTEMAPEEYVRLLQVPLQLEESLVMQIGGGIAYHIMPGISLTSSAQYAHYRDSDLVDRFAGPNTLVTEEGLGFSAYAVRLGLRVIY